MINQNNIEKRKHQRFRMPEDTIVISPNRMGRIIEMSEGGFSAQFIDCSMDHSDTWQTDILFRGNFHENKVRVSVKWMGGIDHVTFGIVNTQTVGLKFVDLSSSQRKSVKSFLSCHGVLKNGE